MSALDEVRAVPGGGALADLAAKMIGDPDTIAAAANAWRTAAGTGRQHTGAVRTAVGDVGEAWQGRSAEAFAGYMDKAVRCGDDLQRALQDCAAHLDAAATALRTAESRALEICASYAAAARDVRGRDPKPTEEQVAQSLQPALNQAHADLQGLFASTGTTVTEAAGKIEAALTTVPNVEKVLGRPDAQPFEPESGKPIGWSPAEQEARPTALSGAPSPGSAGVGFGGYGPSGPPPPGGGSAPPQQVADWINQAITILKAHGVPAEKMNPNDIWLIIKKESNGDPTAINTWDSNAAKGTPSKGLMQTIDPTFTSWKLPGHNDIYNPVDNIIAGVRYAIATYGSVSNVPGVVGMKTGSGYVGY